MSEDTFLDLLAICVVGPSNTPEQAEILLARELVARLATGDLDYAHPDQPHFAFRATRHAAINGWVHGGPRAARNYVLLSRPERAAETSTQQHWHFGIAARRVRLHFPGADSRLRLPQPPDLPSDPVEANALIAAYRADVEAVRAAADAAYATELAAVLAAATTLKAAVLAEIDPGDFDDARELYETFLEARALIESTRPGEAGYDAALAGYNTALQGLP